MSTFSSVISCKASQLGFHFCLRSFSTNTALMPSKKSDIGCGLVVKRCDKRYSIWSTGPMLIVAACCMARSVTLQLVGEQDWNIFCKVSTAKSPVSVFRREIISSTEGALKHLLITSTLSSANTQSALEACRPAAISLMISWQSFMASWPMSFDLNLLSKAFRSFGTQEDGTKCVPTPARRQSQAARFVPVIARKRPTLLPAFRWLSKWVAPTSGKSPIAISGIAKRVFSVTMRKGPWVERPTPPPMVMPSRRLT
mmetsp:Transcript_1170/g.2612  ORF Transcript_1170/g.2612 Transcript_1170/m.2612 type:complete len:255 (+) Transcript_1170:171-935(+)